jgi:hypothetical protein
MIIFLDIDGVLVTYDVVRERDKFYAPAVDALNLFAKIPNCKIVISSAWRIGRTVEELDRLCGHNNVKMRVIGKTDSTKMNGKRGQEILDWIELNKYDGEYVVIDDDMFDIDPFISKENIIYVESGLREKGLTKEHVENFLERKGIMRKDQDDGISKKVIDPFWQIRPHMNAAQLMVKSKDNPKRKRRKKMCSATDFSAIETVVGELVSMRRTFTGQDVYNRIHNKHVRRSVDLSGFQESARGVSAEVRKMFNGKNPVFNGYGSTLVPHDKGPVLYFALPHHAKLKANKIADALNTTS